MCPTKRLNEALNLNTKHPSHTAKRATRHGGARPLGIEHLENRHLLAVVISEFMADNISTLADVDGDFSDWIELHNTGPGTVNLDGWYLTDDDGQLDKWQLPNSPIDPNGYLLVFASGKDRAITNQELHTNFKLSNNGEYLGLVRPDGDTVEFEYSPEFPAQKSDISYGLAADLVTKGYFLAPTPDSANLGDPLEEPDRAVVITEIMYHLPTAGILDAENVEEEFFELYNRGVAPVNLDGWQVDRGVDFTFPNVDIQPGAYLVVAANVPAFQAKYPGVTNVVGGWTGKLSDSSETIRVVDASGVTMDQVTYADAGDWAPRTRGPLDHGTRGWIWDDAHDGGGKSLELINLNLTNNYGQNWSASIPNNGTPGAANSVADTSTAPIILDVQHNPPIPHSTDPVVVSARLVDESADGVAGSVFWRVDGQASFAAIVMADNGLNGDVRGGDGVFSASIPAQANGAVIEYYVSATDAAANTRTWPAPAGSSGQVTNALYQVQNSFVDEWEPGSAAVYFQIMTAAERNEFTNIDRASDAEMNATFISVTGTGIDVVYNAGVRIRGSGSRSETPPNNRIDFPTDKPWHGVTGINLNVVSIHEQIAGSVLFHLAGLPATEVRPVTMYSNGVDLREGQFYAHLEVPNDEFAANHFPNDSGGNIYKGRRADESPPGGQGAGLEYYGQDPAPYVSYLKSTNESAADWTDVIELTNVLNNASNANYVSAVEAIVDVPQWLRVLALTALMDNNEGGLFIGDQQGDDYGMYRGVVDPRFLLLPHDMDTLFSQTNRDFFRFRGVDALDRMLDQPAYLAEYYRQLVDLIDNVLTTDTASASLDEFLRPLVSQAQIDQIKSFLVQRGAYVKSQIPPQYLNPPATAPTSQATAPGAVTNPRINEVLAVNQTSLLNNGSMPDYIELFNAGTTSLDIGDYSLTDHVNSPRKFVFPAGTVLAPGAYLTVLADSAPGDTYLHTGFSLRSEGEAVYLFDSLAHGGSQLDSVVFGAQIADYSIGRQSNGSWTLNTPTPDAANIIQATGDVRDVSINEWMAAEQVTMADDFIELYNADTLPVAIGGVYISDKPNSVPDRHQIAPLSFIAANGFTVFLADGNAGSGPNHLSFKLTADQDLLALFGANLVEVDRVLFDWQATDVSQGRSPDGGAGYGYFTFPTPGLANPSSATVTENVFGYSATWAFHDSGQDLGTAWRNVGYNDSSWNRGPGGLGFENAALPVPLQTPMNPGAITYYLRHVFSLDSDPTGGTFDMTVEIDDGAVVYVNGTEVHRLGMPAGTVTYSTVPTRTVGDATLEGFMIPANLLVQGENLIAVELHQSGPSSSDAVFAARLDSTITNTSSEYADALTIFDGLRITELMYHPVNPLLEYVRVENVGGTAVELAGVQLGGGISYVFSAETLPPGESVFVVADVAAFRAAYGNAPIAGAYTGKLNNAGDDLSINLPSPYGISVLNFHYQQWWQPATDGLGSALQIIDPAFSAAKWNDRTAWQSVVPDFAIGVDGDFNGDGTVNAQDIDALCAETHLESPDVRFDLNVDGMVDHSDLVFLVEQIIGTFMGDANLDGIVDATDLNQVGLHWQQTGPTLGWAQGDFDCNGTVNAADLNQLGINWQSVAPVAAAVPRTARVPRAPLAAGSAHVNAMLADQALAANVATAKSVESTTNEAADATYEEIGLTHVRFRARRDDRMARPSESQDTTDSLGRERRADEIFKRFDVFQF